jgi:hypothetical protein
VDHADVGETSTKPRGEACVELDRNDPRTGTSKRGGENAVTGTEIQHEVARSDRGAADQLVGECAATKCMPPAR